MDKSLHHQLLKTVRSKQISTLRLGVVLFGLCLTTFMAGCDATSRHKVLTTVFDGVPALPPTETLCDDYYLERTAAEAEGDRLNPTPAAENSQRSSHQPYAEKKCDNCHSSDKNLNGGLIVPKQELCFVCHKDFTFGDNVHGPVAVGDCLACHLPHSSNHKALLIHNPDIICVVCHKEERLADAMHDRFVSKSISCGECHDPHSGDARYFLK